MTQAHFSRCADPSQSGERINLTFQWIKQHTLSGPVWALGVPCSSTCAGSLPAQGTSLIESVFFLAVLWGCCASFLLTPQGTLVLCQISGWLGWWVCSQCSANLRCRVPSAGSLSVAKASQRGGFEIHSQKRYCPSQLVTLEGQCVFRLCKLPQQATLKAK